MVALGDRDRPILHWENVGMHPGASAPKKGFPIVRALADRVAGI